MMTSSNGNIFRVTGPLRGEFTGPGEFPTQRPVTRSFDVLFDLCLDKRLSKQPWGWWFETSSWSLWRQCNVTKWTVNTQRHEQDILQTSYFQIHFHHLKIALRFNFYWSFVSRIQLSMSTLVQVMILHLFGTNHVLNRDHFEYAPSQWETTLQRNVVFHWLGTYTKWSLSEAVMSLSRFMHWNAFNFNGIQKMLWCHDMETLYCHLWGESSAHLWTPAPHSFLPSVENLINMAQVMACCLMAPSCYLNQC